MAAAGAAVGGKGWLPLFDFAYQGFARGLEEDAEGLRAFCCSHKELLVASSYSEKLWPVQRARRRLHSGRRGSGDCRPRLQSDEVGDPRQLLEPACAWRLVVAIILSNDALRAIWEQELTDMRQRIQRMRLLFVNTLQEKGARPRLQLYQPAERHVLIQRPD